MSAFGADCHEISIISTGQLGPHTHVALSFTESSLKTGPLPFPVEVADLESFPASDPPSWIGVTIGSPCRFEGAICTSHRSTRHLKSEGPKPLPTFPAAASQKGSSGNDEIRFEASPYAPRKEIALPQPPLARDIAVRIYKPARSPTQSGRANVKHWVLEFEPRVPQEIDPLMGWVGSRDTLQQVRLTFPSKEQAIAFTERQGWPFIVIEPHEMKIRPKSYADNFR
jgi:hypothetical protein